MSDRKAAKLAEADAKLKKAKAATKGGFFSKPDWDLSASLYRDVIKTYSQAGDEHMKKYIDIIIDSLLPHEKIDDLRTCAKNSEKAGQLITEHKTHTEAKAMELLQRSSTWWLLGDDPDKACKLRFTIASLQPTNDKKLESLNEIITMFDQHDRHTFGDASFRKCVSQALEYGEVEGAIAMMYRLIEIFSKLLDERGVDTFENDIYKNCLSIVIVHLDEMEYDKAFEAQDKFINTCNYSSSKESEAAARIIEAYQRGDPKMLATAQKKCGVLDYLPIKVARMAKKLKISQALIESPPGEGKDHDDDDGSSDLDVA